MPLFETSPTIPTEHDAPVRRHRPWFAVLTARRAGALWRHALLAAPLGLLPSLALLGLGYAVTDLLGIDVSSMRALDRELSLEQLFGSVVFAPLAETLLLAGLLWLLSRLSRRPLFVAAASGVLSGAAHGAFGLMWFFGTAWTFYVLSCSYLAWRPLGFWKAFVAAALPHALINLTALSLLFLV